MSTPYDGMLPPSRLDKAVDCAIEEQNLAAYVEHAAIAAENATRWASLAAAERMAGRHGVVLPMATAQAILAALEGRESDLSALSPTLPARMLTQAISRAERDA